MLTPEEREAIRLRAEAAKTARWVNTFEKRRALDLAADAIALLSDISEREREIERLGRIESAAVFWTLLLTRSFGGLIEEERLNLAESALIAATEASSGAAIEELAVRFSTVPGSRDEYEAALRAAVDAPIAD